MELIQLDLFKSEEESEREALLREIAAVKESSNKVRKGTYARINELGKICYDLQTRLEYIEKYICKK